jgi:hypothetical protein
VSEGVREWRIEVAVVKAAADAARRQAGQGVAAGEACEGQRIMDRPSGGGYSAGRRGRRVRV